METSESNFDDVLARLQALEDKKLLIDTRLMLGGFATPEVETSYTKAAETLSAEITGVAGDTDFQDSLAEEGEQSLGAISQLEELRGILPDEEISDQIDQYSGRYHRAAAFFEKYGPITDASERFAEKVAAGGTAVTSTVAIEAVAEPEPSQIETSPPAPAKRRAPKVPRQPRKAVAPKPTEPVAPDETLPTPEISANNRLVVTFRKNVVQLGTKGQIVPFSKLSGEGAYKNYSEERRRALKFILANADREITPKEIWDSIHQDGGEIDRIEFNAVKKWFLNKLTFRRQPIIEKIGDRILTRYKVASNLDVEMVMKDGTEEEDSTGNPKPTDDISGGTGSTNESARSGAETVDHNLPINASNVYLAAHHLQMFNFVLEESGHPVIDGTIVSDLEVYAPDLNDIKDDEDAIKQVRADAVEEVRAFINDEDRFLSYLDGVEDTDSASHKFFEYICDLDGPESRELVDRLLRATLSTEATMTGWRNQGLLDETKLVAVDEFGNVIRPVKPAGVPKASDITDPVALAAVEQSNKEAVIPACQMATTLNRPLTSHDEIIVAQLAINEELESMVDPVEDTGISLDVLDDSIGGKANDLVPEELATSGAPELTDIAAIAKATAQEISPPAKEVEVPESISQIVDELVSTISAAKLPENVGHSRVATTLRWMHRNDVKKHLKDEGRRSKLRNSTPLSYEDIIEIRLSKCPEAKSASRAVKAKIKQLVSKRAGDIRANLAG